MQPLTGNLVLLTYTYSLYMFLLNSYFQRIYVYTKVETEETIQDMLDKYNIAMNNKGAKVQLLQELLKDYKQNKEQVFRDIQGRFKTKPS